MDFGRTNSGEAVDMEHVEDTASCGACCAACIRHKAKPRDPESLRKMQSRLNRMIGQLSGIGRMLDENRYCGDILTQIAAVESALQAFGYLVLQEHMETCVTDDVRAGNNESMREALALMKKLK